MQCIIFVILDAKKWMQKRARNVQAMRTIHSALRLLVHGRRARPTTISLPMRVQLVLEKTMAPFKLESLALPVFPGRNCSKGWQGILKLKSG